jgi:hypothetical protein
MLSETLVTEVGKVMLGKPEHPKKALAPMLVTVVGTDTLVIRVRPINAFAEIVVTLNVSVARVTVDWTVMEPVAVALFDASTAAVFVAAPGVNE